jgi:hypothetical protein
MIKGTSLEPKEGWLFIGKPIDDSEIGSGLVVPNKKMTSFDYKTNHCARFEQFIRIDRSYKQWIAYYAGFAWKQ